MPQVRQTPEPFQSKLVTFLRGHTDVLQRLVAEMYARGLSTRDIEDTLRDGTGAPLLSASAVSELTDRLWEDYATFTKRDLSGFAVEYLFLDAIYESLRLQGGPQEALLCAWAILADGRKVLLHLTLGNKESYEAWLAMLRDLVRRGLRTPVSVTSDGAPGLVRAVEDIWPKSLRLRCWVHKMRNVLDKVPEYARADVKAHLVSGRDAPTYEAGQQALQATLARCGREFPAAMASLADDPEATLAHLRLPAAHRKHVRTTNLIERSFLDPCRPRMYQRYRGKLGYEGVHRDTRWEDAAPSVFIPRAQPSTRPWKLTVHCGTSPPNSASAKLHYTDTGRRMSRKDSLSGLRLVPDQSRRRAARASGPSQNGVW